MKIHLPRRGIAALLHFAANNDIRYYLNGIKVEATAEATRIIATNGHVLGVYHQGMLVNEVDKPTELILPRRVLEMVAKASRHGAMPLWIEGADLAWSLHDMLLDFSLGFKPIEGKFPDYMRVMPKTLSGEVAHFNPEYLMLLNKAARSMGWKSIIPWRLDYNGNNGALGTIPSEPEFCAVIMPMRQDGAGKRPAWLDAPLIAPSIVPAKAAEAVPA